MFEIAMRGVKVNGGVMQKLTLIFLVLGSALECWGQAHEGRKVLSVCELRAHPREYLDKMVVVNGEVAGTWEYGATLSSRQCVSGAAIVESDEMEATNSAMNRAYRAGLDSKMGCLDVRPFVVTVRGRFEIVRGPLGRMCRIVVRDVLSTEYRNGVSERCEFGRGPLPEVEPPVVHLDRKSTR